MKLSKKLAFGYLVLCFLFSLGGCSFLPFGGNKSTIAKEENNKTENVDDRLKTLSKEIQDKTKEIQDKKDQQVEITRNILKISEETPEKIDDAQIAKVIDSCSDSVKRKKNPSDCPLLEGTKKDIDALIKKQKELKNNESELKKTAIAGDDVKKDETKKNENGFNFLDMLLYLVGGIVGLLILGGIGFLGYRFFGKRINQERGEIKQSFIKTESVNQKLSKRVDELEKAITVQSKQFGIVDTELQKLKVQIAKISGQPYQPTPIREQIPDYKAKPQFPVSAEEYLNEVRPFAKTASADVIAGLLIPDSGKGDEFLIVKDSELSENLFYAVPNQARFNTKGEYLNYYQNYYAFENPSSGSILIKSPTIVRRVQGGLKLEKMGELEVR
jgi:chaperonin cofactor prefoldin